MKKNRLRPEAYINGRKLKPESLMSSYGYNPFDSEGSVKPPIFQTSTWAAESAEDLERFFKDMHSKTPKSTGLVYSRLNHPNLEILEDRLKLWNEEDACAVFDSGMSAISATCHCLLRPGDFILHSDPLYGGTEHFFQNELSGVNSLGFPTNASPQKIESLLAANIGISPRAMIWIESPANPTLRLVDIEACAKIARRYSHSGRQIWLAVDNTFLGPLWQNPALHGADLVVYSATKYIGGHSDLIAGAVLGASNLIWRIKSLRKEPADAFTCWLIMRSLETLKLRMTKQMENAEKIAAFLKSHKKISRTYYLGHIKRGDPQFEIYERQCTSPGAMISFDIGGGKKPAFRFLNALKLIKIAVSLGGTESLAEHPASTTHSNLSLRERRHMEIGEGMIRLSVGLEDAGDLIFDIAQALKKA